MSKPMTNKRTRKAISALVCVTVFASFTSFVSAQIAAPEPIDSPVKEKWRAPFQHFLEEMGVKDAIALIGKTNAFQIGGAWHPDSILFRTEDKSLCSGDLCFTVIGRVTGDKFTADAMFGAGKRFTRGDVFRPLLGFQTLPAWLVGEKTVVTLLETPQGWIITSESNSAFGSAYGQGRKID